MRTGAPVLSEELKHKALQIWHWHLYAASHQSSMITYKEDTGGFKLLLLLLQWDSPRTTR